MSVNLNSTFRVAVRQAGTMGSAWRLLDTIDINDRDIAVLLFVDEVCLWQYTNHRYLNGEVYLFLAGLFRSTVANLKSSKNRALQCESTSFLTKLLAQKLSYLHSSVFYKYKSKTKSYQLASILTLAGIGTDLKPSLVYPQHQELGPIYQSSGNFYPKKKCGCTLKCEKKFIPQ